LSFLRRTNAKTGLARRGAQGLLVFGVLALLTWRTGFFGDDFGYLQEFQRRGWVEFFAFPFQIPPNLILQNLPSYFLFWWVYPFGMADQAWLVDLGKAGWGVLCWLILYWHLAKITDQTRAFLVSLFFLLWPTHETTLYWYMAAPYALTAALALASFIQIGRGRHGWGLCWGFAGAFSNMSSLPYFAGFALWFLLRKQIRNAAAMFLPGLAYGLFYLALMQISPESEKRIADDLSAGKMIQGLSLQLATGLDVMIGPSFFLKLWSAGVPRDPFAVLACFLLAAGVVALGRPVPASGPAKAEAWGLVLAAALVSLAASVMYSLTGMYPQIVFNLGNRTAIYFCLPVILALALVPRSALMVRLLFLGLVIPICGLSSHWRTWGDAQRKTLVDLRENQTLVTLKEGTLVVFSSRLYSRLGSYDHIEFLVMPWVAEGLFRQINPLISAAPISNLTVLNGQTLRNEKFHLTYPIPEGIYLYDADDGGCHRISREELGEILARLAPFQRHWLQALPWPGIRKLLGRLSPRIYEQT